MKNNTNFSDALKFILSENSFHDFFIVYDKKLKKIIPYIPPEEDQKESLFFQIASINIRDKNKYFVLHSTEFPSHLFDKRDFITHTVNNAIIESTERNFEKQGENLEFLEDVVNLNKFFEYLSKNLKLNKAQIERLTEIAGYYTDSYILEPDDDFGEDEEDSRFSKFEDEINIAINLPEFNADAEIKLAMIEHINDNMKLIEDMINKSAEKIIKLIEPTNMKRNEVKL